MPSTSKLIRSVGLAGAVLAFVGAMSAFAAPSDTVADRVLGQPNFTSNTANSSGVSASSLNTPAGGFVDGGGRLWVADSSNNRVLEYDSPLTTAVANRVFGQPDFTSNDANNGGVSASSLSTPASVAVDNGGRLWVADYGNNRVVEYDSPLTSAVANRVFGQPDLISNTANDGGVSAGSLSRPLSVAVDSGGRLWVAEYGNDRVLEYDSPLTTAVANRAFGQPDFTSNTANNGGVSASSLSTPNSVALDSSGRLWVTDGNNNRILEYDSPLTTAVANRAFGQPDFTSNTANNGGVSASSSSFPAGVAVDGAGRLWVADLTNNRLLEYDAPLSSAVASRVFGQPDFTSNTANDGGVSASGLSSPGGIAVDSGGRLWVSDQTNSRLLEYDGVASIVGSVASTPVLPRSGTGGARGGGQRLVVAAVLSGLATGIGSVMAGRVVRRRRLSADVDFHRAGGR